SRIEQVDAAEFSDFIARHGHTPLGPWLRQGWLNQRARQRDWGAFVAHYDSALRATELACHHAHAQYAVGDRQLGIQLARELWQVGTSQPRACDPVFAHLIEGEHIDDDLAWRRFVAALMNHEFTLARYVTGFFNTEKARQRALWYL